MKGYEYFVFGPSLEHQQWAYHWYNVYSVWPVAEEVIRKHTYFYFAFSVKVCI